MSAAATWKRSMQETGDVERSILAALQNTRYFRITRQAGDIAEFDRLLASGEVLFGVEIPAGFERAAARRPPRAAGGGGCHRSGGSRLGARRPGPSDATGVTQ
jgi:hypothetical protein